MSWVELELMWDKNSKKNCKEKSKIWPEKIFLKKMFVKSIGIESGKYRSWVSSVLDVGKKAVLDSTTCYLFHFHHNFFAFISFLYYQWRWIKYRKES